MADAVNAQLMDEVTSGNLKILADMAQSAMGLSVQNAVANQQTVQAMVNANMQNALLMAQAITARAVRFTFDTSAEQATSFAQQIAADAGEKLAEAGATLSATQQYAKIAQSTAPQTGTGGAFGSETGLSQQIALSLANLAQSQATIIELLKVRPAG